MGRATSLLLLDAGGLLLGAGRLLLLLPLASTAVLLTAVLKLP
jgi:hypothetical protein